MNVKYRIINKDLKNRQIVVRFFTDIVTELYLASVLDPETKQPIGLDTNGVPYRCRTDVSIQYPIQILTSEQENKLIMRHCDHMWLANEERTINSKNDPDAELIAVVDAISAMSDSVGVLNFNPTLSLVEKKTLMWTRIKMERDRRIQSGGYKVGSKWYHSDTFSRTQQMGLVMLGANIPANTPWKTMDGSFVVMTQTLSVQIFGAAAASDISVFSAAEKHNAAMELLEEPTTYNYMTEWPLAFSEQESK